jgi:methylmalonyl-CoA mutase N-terminal domain/subunit
MDDARQELEAFFTENGAGAQGILPDEGSHALSTGEAVPFLVTHLDAPRPALELPGRFPFRRGVFPTMYRGRTWTMRQYAGFGTAEDTNRRFRYLLDRGQTGLSVAFDLPSQMGLDPDDPAAHGEVGRAGVSLATVDDMSRIFEDIPLDQVSVSMTANATAPIIMGMLQVVAEERGISPGSLTGTTQNDVLKEYIARGTFIYPVRASLSLAADLIAWCNRVMPRWNPISISGYHIREAGADAVQELGFTLANGLAYVQAAMDRGLAVDRFAPRLSFFFAAHNHFFEEIAKFRAARVAWATLMRDRMGALDERSLAMRFHTQTAGSTLTGREPENNVVRVALQALAAVLGGTQSLHTNALDEALSLPSEETAGLALRTQQVIAEESRVADFVDPLGGSYLVEMLTDRMVRESLELVERIETMGGMVSAIESGWVQRRIEDSAYRFQQAVDSGVRPVVGVNCHRDDSFAEQGGVFACRTPPGLERRRADAAMDASRCEAMEEFRARRDATSCSSALEGVRDAARSGSDVIESIVEAVRRRATLGEVTTVLASVHGRASLGTMPPSTPSGARSR